MYELVGYSTIFLNYFVDGNFKPIPNSKTVDPSKKIIQSLVDNFELKQFDVSKRKIYLFVYMFKNNVYFSLEKVVLVVVVFQEQDFFVESQFLLNQIQ